MQQRVMMKYIRSGGLRGAEVILNGEAMEQVVKFYYVGVDIDEWVQWKER